MAEISRELLMERPIGPVRISMPAKVAYNMDAFKETLVDVLEELGCRACFSGADCTFQLERDFVINPALQLSTREPVALRRNVAANDVTVNLTKPEIGFEIDSVFSTLDRVLGKLGCLACCSGFDITFRNEWRSLEPRLTQTVLNI